MRQRSTVFPADPCPHAIAYVSHTRSSLTAAVGKAKRRLSVMATSRTRLKRSKETLTALQSLNIEVYNEELEVARRECSIV